MSFIMKRLFNLQHIKKVSYILLTAICINVTLLVAQEPLVLPINLSVRQVFNGNSNTCFVTTNNKLYCYGKNSFVQLGDGTTENKNYPVEIESLQDVSHVEISKSINYPHTCTIKTNGDLYCFGNNQFGQSHIRVSPQDLCRKSSRFCLRNP